MKSYSQSQEDLFVLNHFKGFRGTLLEIGANDGETLSNSKLLIENGWEAHLLEPASVFGKLSALHADNPYVTCYNFGIGEVDAVVDFYESGAHVQNGSDRALVSSCDYEETQRWRDAGVPFIETNIQLVTWETFAGDRMKFDFISIDAEGCDWQILQQIDLNKVGCKCLVIEWNGKEKFRDLFTDYCSGFGLTLVHENTENLLFVR